MVDVDIVNLALAYLGDSATVSTLDPPLGSAQAQHCARFYPIALRLLLESHQWNFSTTRVALAPVVIDGYFGVYQYAYALPTNVADIISVLPTAVYPQGYFGSVYYGYGRNPIDFLFELTAMRDFHVEVRNGQQVILTNAPDAILRYTMTEAQPGSFSALFTDALAWKLASMLAGPLLKGDVGAAESKRCLQMYGVMIEQAKGQDSNDQHDTQNHIPSFIQARN